MSTATFIFSLDCEGKWGAADRLSGSAYERFTTAGLANIYRQLVARLDYYEIAATFAFVSMFCMTREQLSDNSEWIAPLPYQGKDWFAPFRRDLESGNLDGWLCPEALESVAASGEHEIASHGFSHIPLGDGDVEADIFCREMEAIRAGETIRNYHSDTFVYPRNRVGHTDLLARHGYKAYRPANPQDVERSPLARISRLVSDVSPFERLNRHSSLSHPVILPPGRMLLVRTWNRRWIATRLIAKKFAHMLDRAIEQGGVFHVYTHPHNFLTGHDQFEILEALLKAVAERARHGELVIMTQRRYCEWLEFGHRPGAPVVSTGHPPSRSPVEWRDGMAHPPFTVPSK